MSSIKDPVYRLHKPSGRAIVTLPDGLGGRHDVYLGEHGTEASEREYRRVLAEWRANGRKWRKSEPTPDMTIHELVDIYWDWVQNYYRHADGSFTSEPRNIRQGLRRMVRLYGDTAANAFDGVALEAVRNRMIEDGLCRGRINRDVARIKRLFKWAVPKKLVPLAVHQELETVEGLRAGRSKARETPPVRPVSETLVEATLPKLRPPVAAMVQLQLLTGMRPGEVTIMRAIDLEMKGKVWRYRPATHKTAHRGHERVISIGPRGQQIIREFLRRDVSAYLFSPADSMEHLRAEQHENRKSKVPPSQQNRRLRKPEKVPGDRYTTCSYACAIARGCRTAFPFAYPELSKNSLKKWIAEHKAEVRQWHRQHHWHPHQLRHTKATEIRRVADLDAARAILGHRSLAVTEVYAEMDQEKAAKVMEMIG
jgi:integrase